jgi:hypothetical protein
MARARITLRMQREKETADKRKISHEIGNFCSPRDIKAPPRKRGMPDLLLADLAAQTSLETPMSGVVVRTTLEESSD